MQCYANRGIGSSRFVGWPFATAKYVDMWAPLRWLRAVPVLGLWLILWPVLFQPLLGVHMLATIVSPIIGKMKDAGIVSKDTWT